MSQTTQEQPAVNAPWQTRPVRRSPSTWINGYPRSVSKRTPKEKVEPKLIRFSRNGQAARDTSVAVAERAQLVRVEWSESEREARRLQAARKQEELLMLLADDQLEECMRLAVANGELPVSAPTMESCEI